MEAFLNGLIIATGSIVSALIGAFVALRIDHKKKRRTQDVKASLARRIVTKGASEDVDLTECEPNFHKEYFNYELPEIVIDIFEDGKVSFSADVLSAYVDRECKNKTPIF
ncbi:MAG: hypothetical protein ABW148_17300 [Sedimenticola sp.]